ncbi:MAG: hypothetical protein GF364_06235 [Candidatus Lokiarchaeota archaeon]|nr:hypothetical protein [Candidatus Lokiarchaeota archaeon]
MKEKKLSDFFTIYRKNGMEITLNTLAEFENHECTESEFFDKLKSSGSYLNEYYRSKDTMLHYGLISYKLNENYDKVIFLTEAGDEVQELVERINTILKENVKKE